MEEEAALVLRYLLQCCMLIWNIASAGYLQVFLGDKKCRRTPWWAVSQNAHEIPPSRCSKCVPDVQATALHSQQLPFVTSCPSDGPPRRRFDLQGVWTKSEQQMSAVLPPQRRWREPKEQLTKWKRSTLWPCKQEDRVWWFFCFKSAAH